ncbi:hypothetical protein QTI66_01180 [Variovorax sp. J22R133]|uniref:hypothetical protein n=1 Tax=Variovorax brevis TaxID=3053503 RepID=UPI002577893B|nr:hypothetical protein [Variovorax sp. J22R133]MDM0110737.1 hypothetical protein [Variovorax sp. J22R133]
MKLSSRSLFWSTTALALVAAASALLHPNPAVAGDRTYLSSESQVTLIDSAMLSRNLQSGAASRWEFQPSGPVDGH